MSPVLRKIILYFLVILCSALIMAWLVLPFVVFYKAGKFQFVFTRIFATIGYFGLGLWLYTKYFPWFKERVESNKFFKF